MRDARAVLVLDARPRDPLALWSLRVADDASRAVYGWPAVDEPWTRDQIAAAQRAPGTVGAMRLPAGLDTRWWWLGALVLVLVEGLVRRRLAEGPVRDPRRRRPRRSRVAGRLADAPLAVVAPAGIGEAALWATSAALALLALTASVALAVAGGVAVALWRTLSGGLVHDVRAMLRAVEASEPRSGNALLTWHEVDSGALATPPVFQRQLADQARAGLRGTRPPAPWRARHWAVAAAAVCAALLLVWLVPAFAPGGNLGDAATSSRQTASMATTGAAVSVSFVVTPPAYTGRPPSGIADASVVDALVGSSVRARYAGLPAGAVVRVGSRAVTMTFPSEGTAQAEAAFEVDASALLTVHDEAGQAVASTAIQAVPDAPPLVRIEQPGQDLRVADAARRVPIVITAADDIGLRMLRLRYTRVSGSGESFEFTDGELPVEVRRASTTSWQGRATNRSHGTGDGPRRFARVSRRGAGTAGSTPRASPSRNAI